MNFSSGKSDNGRKEYKRFNISRIGSALDLKMFLIFKKLI